MLFFRFGCGAPTTVVHCVAERSTVVAHVGSAHAVAWHPCPLLSIVPVRCFAAALCRSLSAASHEASTPRGCSPSPPYTPAAQRSAHTSTLQLKPFICASWLQRGVGCVEAIVRGCNACELRRSDDASASCLRFVVVVRMASARRSCSDTPHLKRKRQFPGGPRRRVIELPLCRCTASMLRRPHTTKYLCFAYP